MADDNLPGGALPLEFDPAPAPETRATLAREINDFNSRAFPYAPVRFAFLSRDEAGALRAGVMGTVSWGWLFVEAVWVSEALRGRGVGRTLMEAAERHARDCGCHSVWLDTFQAQDFYLRLGYETFGVLDDYPRGQRRAFMRKALTHP
jgi:ribosomal protein S18 acetylase RimI-like enzyme